MSRVRLLILAALAGVALGAGYLLARPDDQPPAVVAVQSTPRPAILVVLDRRADPMRITKPGIASTAKIVARAADPAGGPDWVLRTYQRPSQSGTSRVWCAQLGRLVDGAVAWVAPGKRYAIRLPLGDAGTTSCAFTAPISERLGINSGGFPDGDPGDPTTRVRTSMVWGVVDRRVASARIERSALAGPVRPVRHGFLIVRRSDGPPPAARLVVRDLDGGTRAAIPPGAFTELPLPRPSGGRSVPPWLEIPREVGRTLSGDRYTIVAKTPADRVGIISALFAVRAAGHRPCVTPPVDTIGGRPAQTWYQGHVGLVREPLLQCRFVPKQSDGKPLLIGGGSQSGFDPDYPVRASADRRSLTQRRRPPAITSITVATPPGARYLEVHSPVGVTTVRVSWARVTVVSWDGQPEVGRALFPQYRKVAGITRLIGGGGVTFRALDSDGRQIGRPGRTR